MSTEHSGNPERPRLHLVAALCVRGTGLGAVKYPAGRCKLRQVIGRGVQLSETGMALPLAILIACSGG